MLDGGDGDDLIYGNQGSDTLHGGADSDTIYGGQNDGPASLDAIGNLRMMEGLEFIDGQGGNDLIYGQFGDEVLQGGSGIDTIFGGQGDDSISGGGDTDYIFGNRGDDTIYGGGGKDVLYFAGDFGNDSIADFAPGDDVAIVDGDLTDTTTVGGNTIFSFENGSSIEFKDVILTSGDLAFV